MMLDSSMPPRSVRLMKTGGLTSVEPQASVVQFAMKDVEVPVLERVNDVENHVSTANHVEDFAALDLCPPWF